MSKSAPKLSLLECTPFLLIHLVAIAGVFLVPFSWPLVGLCLGMYVLRMFGITAGFHRYFSHRAYKLGRVSQFLMAILGTASAQKGVLWWAAHHRHHHRFSDQPNDLHSPIQSGFWWSHMGWFLCEYEETRYDQIQDFAKYPELVWLNKYHLVPPVVLAVSIFLLGGWAALIWGFFMSTVLLWHGTFTINSLSHVFGSRRYETRDTSRNNAVLALITLGEGWHNNHHCYQSSCRQGFFWWEFDLSYYALKALSWVGVVRDIRQPPLALLENKLIRPSSGLRTRMTSPPSLSEPQSASHS